MYIDKDLITLFIYILQKQPFRGVLRKRCSENMQPIYRRSPMPKWDFNKVVLLKLFYNFIEITPRYGCLPVNLLRILRTPFYKNTYGAMQRMPSVFISQKQNCKL